MDNEIYDMPLTIRLKNYGEWEAAKIVQGDNVQYALTEFDKNGQAHLQFDVIPDIGKATVTPCLPSEIPN